MPIRASSANLQPEFLLGATNFKTTQDRTHGRWLIETLRSYEGKGQHDICAPLDRVVRNQLSSTRGRPRLDGKWYLAYLAFVFSRHADVKPWWQQAGHSIWTTAGFKERPSYNAVQMRFAELERAEVAAAFEEAASILIRSAIQATNGRVGRYLHIDSTEAETHARLRHICPEGRDCWTKYRRRPRRKNAKTADPDDPTATPDGKVASNGEDDEGLAYSEGGPFISANEPTTAVRSERHEDAAELEPEWTSEEEMWAEDTELGDATQLVRSDSGLTFKVGDCWFEVLDHTAGIRAYIRPGKNGNKVVRFWVGFYNCKLVDHFTGAPVAVVVKSASTNEHAFYPEVLQAGMRNTGVKPDAVIGDRGYAISGVFEHNTRQGIASVFPWRGSRNRPTRDLEDCELHDRHGVVRCKHCGGATKFSSFTATSGAYGTAAGRGKGKKDRGPRLYVTCATPVMPSCNGRQSLYCAESWRMLIPLWRTTPLYLALRHSHERYERVHHMWRIRWRVASDNHALRPKRRGRDCQQLRANAALLCEWLLICWREGWMPGETPQRPDPERVIAEDGEAWAEHLEKTRVKLGLHRPYGERAVQLGLTDKLRPTTGSNSTAVAEQDPSEPEITHASDIPTDPDPTSPEPLNAAEVDVSLDDPDDLPF